MMAQTISMAGSASVDPLLLPHLLSIAKTIRQLVSLKLADCEVAAGQDQFLLSFAEREAVSVADIASRLAVRASTVSKMTDILQRKGWVSRQSDNEDARKVLVQLTEAGGKVRDVVRAIEDELEVELWRLVGEDDEIVSALSKLDAILIKRLSRLR